MHRQELKNEKTKTKTISNQSVVKEEKLRETISDRKIMLKVGTANIKANFEAITLE